MAKTSKVKVETHPLVLHVPELDMDLQDQIALLWGQNISLRNIAGRLSGVTISQLNTWFAQGEYEATAVGRGELLVDQTGPCFQLRLRCEEQRSVEVERLTKRVFYEASEDARIALAVLEKIDENWNRKNTVHIKHSVANPASIFEAMKAQDAAEAVIAQTPSPALPDASDE